LESFGTAGAGVDAVACGWVHALAAGLPSHLEAQQLALGVVVTELVDSLIIV
jgi:hypothetical protein